MIRTCQKRHGKVRSLHLGLAKMSCREYTNPHQKDMIQIRIQRGELFNERGKPDQAQAERPARIPGRMETAGGVSDHGPAGRHFPADVLLSAHARHHPGLQELPDDGADGDLFLQECIPEQPGFLSVERAEQLHVSAEGRGDADPEHGGIQPAVHGGGRIPAGGPGGDHQRDAQPQDGKGLPHHRLHALLHQLDRGDVRTVCHDLLQRLLQPGGRRDGEGPGAVLQPEGILAVDLPAGQHLEVYRTGIHHLSGHADRI